MTKSEAVKRTISYYDDNAEDWSSLHFASEDTYWREQMARYHELLPSGKIIEIGSGSGKDAAALIEMGYEYTGTDASNGLISVAKKRNPSAKFINCTVDKLHFPKGYFDGFWTAATLLHIPKNLIGEALQSIRQVIRPDGIGFISMKAGNGERIDEKTGRWFSYYSGDEFRDVLEKNKFRIVDQETKKGDKDWWLIYFVSSQG